MAGAEAAARIAEAAAAFDRGDPDTALLVLVELWREHRSAHIADAIDRVAGARPGNSGKNLTTKAWHAMAARRDPRELDRLLARPWPRVIKPLTAALAALYEWDDDPRIARALVRFVADTGIWTDAYCELQSRALARLARLRDTRVVATLESMRVHSDIARSLRLTLLTLENHSAQLPEPALAALAAIGADDASELGLLAAITATPDDPSAYEVWGDWLIQHSDPRGELFALQKTVERGVATPDDLRRIAALIEQHGVRWAGGLGAYFKRETWHFERGLFAGGELVEGVDFANAFTSHTCEVLADPAWAFVRVIRVDPDNELVQRHGARIVAAAPNVRSFGVVSVANAVRVASATLRELEIATYAEIPRRGRRFTPAGGDPIANRVDERIADLPALPALVRLTIFARVTPTFIASAPVIAQLTSLVLQRPDVDSLVALAAREAPRLRSVCLDALANLVLSRDVGHGPFTHATATITEPRDIERIALSLSRVPPTWLRSIVVTGRVALVEGHDTELVAFERAIARFSPAPQVDVWWFRPTPTTGPQRYARAELSGARVLDAELFPLVWDQLAGLGQRYDMITVNGGTRCALGDAPVDRVQGFIAKHVEHCVLSRSGSIEHAELRNTNAIKLVLSLGTVTDDQLETWFIDLVEFVGATSAHLARADGKGNRAIYTTLSADEDRLPHAWLVVLGPAVRHRLEPDVVRAIANAHSGLADLRVTATANYLALRTTRSIDRELSYEGFAALDSAMRAELRRH